MHYITLVLLVRVEVCMLGIPANHWLFLLIQHLC
jgi:hypothetical protein